MEKSTCARAFNGFFASGAIRPTGTTPHPIRRKCENTECEHGGNPGPGTIVKRFSILEYAGHIVFFMGRM